MAADKSLSNRNIGIVLSLSVILLLLALMVSCGPSKAELQAKLSVFNEELMQLLEKEAARPLSAAEEKHRGELLRKIEEIEAQLKAFHE